MEIETVINYLANSLQLGIKQVDGEDYVVQDLAIRILSDEECLKEYLKK